MSQQEHKWGFQETQQHGFHARVVAPRQIGSSFPNQLQHNLTLDMRAGLGLQKVLPPSNEQSFETFYFSGKTGRPANAEAAKYMVDTMPSFDNVDADFNIDFTGNLKLRVKKFEDHAHWVPKGKRGEGVSGTVTAHVDTQSKVSFVRKKIKKGTKLRREELKAMLAVNHPGICSLYGLMVHGETVDILMQDAGHPLRDFLRTVIQKGMQEGIRPDDYWRLVTDFTLQGFTAIRQMHQASVYHLDIKPENFLAHMDQLGKPRLVLADFGSALIGRRPMDLCLQLTPEYMAPELWKLYRQHGKNSNCKDPVEPSFDNFAFGLTVYFMCTLRHLMLELLKKKDDLVHPSKVQEFTKGVMDPGFGFKFLLMTEFAHIIPQLASSGPWVFPNSPPPIHLLEIINRTLDPNPESRWTEENVIAFLTGEPVVERNSTEVEDVFRTPTQATDTGSSQDEELILEDNMQQMINLRRESMAANPGVGFGFGLPVTEYQEVMQPEAQDADVRSYVPQAQAQPCGPPSAAFMSSPAQVFQTVREETDQDLLRAGFGQRQRAQPMRLNVDLMDMDMEEERLQPSAATIDKADVDMDMHLRVTYPQAEVPDLPVVERFEMQVLKKPNICLNVAQDEESQGATSPRAQAQMPVYQYRALGVVPKFAPGQAGLPQAQPPPCTALGKGGGFRCPVKQSGKRGKHAGVGDPHRGVSQVSKKTGSGVHDKNAAFLSYGKKMRLENNFTAMSPVQPSTPQVSFIVGSSARPSLATRVIPPPAPSPGFAPGSLANCSEQFNLPQASPLAPNAARVGAIAGQKLIPKPAATPKRHAFVSPWAVADPVVHLNSSHSADLFMDQTEDGGGDVSQEGMKAMGVNVPNLNLLLP